MQAEIRLGEMRRTRALDYPKLFINNDPKKEVRAEWSDLFRKFYRHRFEINLHASHIKQGGQSFQEAGARFVEMFGKLEEWCDTNCEGHWTCTDNEEDIDEDQDESDLQVFFMFEFEGDLETFIKHSALIAKLAN